MSFLSYDTGILISQLVDDSAEVPGTLPKWQSLGSNLCMALEFRWWLLVSTLLELIVPENPLLSFFVT